MLGLEPGAKALSPEAAGVVRTKEMQRRGAMLRPGYCLAIGGNATSGRFVARPWPQLLERRSGRVVCNFARPHAGLDALIGDVELLRVAALADLRLVEVPDAITLSNPYYAVHPRRNDRFVRAEPALLALFPDVDFTQIAFTRHLVLTLLTTDPLRFEVVRQGLAARWCERMEELIIRLEGRTVLIWWANRPPALPSAPTQLRPGAPQLVDSTMLAAVRHRIDGLVKVVMPDLMSAKVMKGIDPTEVVAARELPGPEAHAAIARRLLPWLRQPKL